MLPFQIQVVPELQNDGDHAQSEKSVFVVIARFPGAGIEKYPGAGLLSRTPN